jgi:large subunit ribosomal protein L25
METVQLAANTRHSRGSRLARLIRRGGKIPAILYGHGMKSLAIEVDKQELHIALHTKAGENVLINLKVQGADLTESTCLIKDIQHHPVTDEIQHVDFTLVSLTEKIEVKVPISIKHADDALGVKEGGILDVLHYEIEVECLPTQIPEKIEVDIKGMKIEDAIHVRDLSIPEGVICKLPPEEVIVALHAPKKEVAAPAVEEEVTQPEVIEKGKKVEVEEGAEAPPKSEAGKKPEK